MILDKYKIETYNRKTVFMELKQIDSLAKEGSFMELTVWANEEGFDCTIDDKTMQFTFDEFRAMKFLVKKLIG
jgi:hypothetical protein